MPPPGIQQQSSPVTTLFKSCNSIQTNIHNVHTNYNSNILQTADCVDRISLNSGVAQIAKTISSKEIAEKTSSSTATAAAANDINKLLENSKGISPTLEGSKNIAKPSSSSKDVTKILNSSTDNTKSMKNLKDSTNSLNSWRKVPKILDASQKHDCAEKSNDTPSTLFVSLETIVGKDPEELVDDLRSKSVTLADRIKYLPLILGFPDQAQLNPFVSKLIGIFRLAMQECITCDSNELLVPLFQALANVPSLNPVVKCKCPVI